MTCQTALMIITRFVFIIQNLHESRKVRQSDKTSFNAINKLMVVKGAKPITKGE